MGIDVGEQHLQRGTVHLVLKVPALSVGPRPQGTPLVGAQGAGGAKTGHIHLLIEHIGQAHIVDGAAGGLVADGASADGHIGGGFLGDGAGGAGQAPGGKGGQGQDAHDAHQGQDQAQGAVEKAVFQDIFLQSKSGAGLFSQSGPVSMEETAFAVRPVCFYEVVSRDSGY